MSIVRRHFLASAVALALGFAANASFAADPAKPSLTLGATVGYNYDVLKRGIAPQLEKQGYKVKLVEFNDYVQPNMALSQGALDANLFQHITYLNRFKTDQKLDLTDLVQSTTAPMGVYSNKRKSLSEAKEGDRITVPNDPSNLARALLLLQQNGVLTVKSDIDPLRVTEKDIVNNPNKVKLQPIEAAQLPRTLDDVEFVVVPGNFATSAGLKFTSALNLEKPPVAYQQVVAVRTADKDTAWAKDLAAAFKSPFFKDVLTKDFAGYTFPQGL